MTELYHRIVKLTKDQMLLVLAEQLYRRFV